MIVDILMFILILLEYSKIYTGQLAHEIFGSLLVLLVIAHNIININFYKSIFKGKYNTLRIANLVTNIAFLFCMLVTFCLAVPISDTIFSFINVHGNMTVRKLHSVFGYWSMAFLGLHLGLHFRVIFANVRKKLNDKKAIKYLIYILEIIIIILGIKFMIDSNFLMHLTGKYSFGTYSNNVFVSLMKNFCIVSAISELVHNIIKIWKKKTL